MKLPDEYKPPWLRRENTAGRVVWIIWCLGWAAVWAFTVHGATTTYYFGYVQHNYSPVGPEIAFWLSLAALLLPVGKK